MDSPPIQESEKDVSMIVHADDRQSDLEADLMASETNDEKANTVENEETNGSIEMEKISEEKAKDETEQSKKKGRTKPKREKLDSDRAPFHQHWNLRITGLGSNTCLDELKRLCGQYGTVLGGKMLSKKRKTGVQYRACIGMSHPDEAEKCIAFLNQTKIDGHRIKIQKKRWSSSSLWRRLERSRKQEESLRLFQIGELLRWEQMKMQNQNLSKCEIGRQLLELNFRWTEVLRLNEMRNAIENCNGPRSAQKQKPSDRPMGSQMNSFQMPTAFQAPFQNQSWPEPQDQSNPDGPTQSKKKRNRKGNSLFERQFYNQPWLKDTIGFLLKLQDRNNPHNAALWNGPMGLILRNSPMLSVFQLLLQSQLSGNKNTDYGKQVQHNEGRSGRASEGGSQSDIPEEKQMKQQHRPLFTDVQKKVEEQIEEKLKQLRELMQSIQRPLNQRKQYDEPKRPNMSNYNNTSRFNPSFQNESRYNEYRNTDYGRWADQKGRGMPSWEMGPLQDFQGRNETWNDGWSRTNENWMGFDGRRDMGRSREPERRYFGPNQEQGSCNRTGQMRSYRGGGSNQRSWVSSSGNRKVDNWSHAYRDVGNSNMNQPNDQWFGNTVNSTGRDATGAFVDNSRTNRKGKGYNQRPTNNRGKGYNQRSTNNRGKGYNQRPTNSEGMGYNQGPTNSEGMGYNQGATNSDGMGYNQGPTNSDGMGYSQGPTNSEGMGYNQGATNSDGMGYSQGPTNSEGMGYNQGPTNSDGMGYNQGPTNSDGMGYNQGPTNSEGMGYNQGPTNSEGMGYNQGPTNSEGMGYNQGPTNSEGMGYIQGPTNSEGMGYNQKSTNMFDNSQSQDGTMMNTHGGNNWSGQMQQPYFNAYNTGYQN